jgi:hypothetical protein
VTRFTGKWDSVQMIRRYCQNQIFQKSSALPKLSIEQQNLTTGKQASADGTGG